MNNKNTTTWKNLRNVILFINYDNKIQNKGKSTKSQQVWEKY